MLVEQFDQFGEVCQRAGQAVDLVDDNDIDLPATNIPKQSLQGRAIRIATGKPAIVILGSNQRPAGVRLASDSPNAHITLALSSTTGTSDDPGGTYTSDTLAGQLSGSSTFQREIVGAHVWLDTSWPELQSGNMG